MKFWLQSQTSVQKVAIDVGRQHPYGPHYIINRRRALIRLFQQIVA